MKKRFGQILVAALLILLCAIMSLGSAVTAVAVDSASLDFGIVGSESNEKLSPSELFETLYPELSLSDAEGKYLDSKLVTLTYNSHIPQETIRTLYHKDTGVLDIRATAFTYTAGNGSRVSWIPTQVTIENRTYSFVASGADEYVCNFDNLRYADDFEMSVDFRWDVELPTSVTDALLFDAETDGKTVSDALEAYETDMLQYREQLQAYEKYSVYEKEYAAYKAYLEAYSAYLIQQERYEAYISAKERYEAEAEAYNQYLVEAEEYRVAWEKYQTYLSYVRQNEQAYAKYLEYSSVMDTVAQKLNIMEMMIVRDTNGWSIYRDIQGKTVSSVLENKNQLTQIGYTRAEDAARSTEALRVLLKGYVSLRATRYPTVYLKHKALYTYYQEHYEEIKENLIMLYEALYNLYGHGIIVDKIEKEGKGVHFRQFLASLYIACCCLDDSSVLSLDWTPGYYFSETLANWVEPLHLISDNVQASPAGVNYPTEEVKKVVMPDPVPSPGDAPVRVDPPSTKVPQEVARPTEPVAVQNPGEAPPYAEKPDAIPNSPKFTDAELAWADVYRQVDFTGRDAYRGKNTLTMHSRLKRSVSVDNSYKITFYSYDGTTICFEQTLKYGDSAKLIDYSHRPVRENTAQYLYEFHAWTLFGGEIWEGEIIESDLSFVPQYRTTVCEYTVTWIVDGESLTQKYAYGSVPSYPYLLQKAPDAHYTYTFSGWDKEILPVVEDVTYRGEFHATEIFHTVTWKYAGNQELVQTYRAGELPTFEGMLNYADSTHYHRFVRWNAAILPVTGSVTYTAIYASEPFSMDAYGALTEVEHTESSVIAKVSGTAIRFANLAKYAMETEKDLILQSRDVSLGFDTEAVARLFNMGCTKIVLSEEYVAFGTAYAVRAYDLLGASIELDAPVTLLVSYTPGQGKLPVCYRSMGDLWVSMECVRESGTMRIEANARDTLLVRDEYDLKYNPVSNCNVLTLLNHASAGEWVDLRAECVYGYEIAGATVTCADGTVIPVENLGFYMPEQAVTIDLHVQKIVYYVSFVVDGKTVLEREYGLGEKIELPENPTLEKNDGFVYTFAGWSPEATLAIGNERNMVFEAQFLQGKLSDNEAQKDLVDNAVAVRLTLLAILAFLMVAIPILLIIFRRRVRAFTLYVISTIAAKRKR